MKLTLRCSVLRLICVCCGIFVFSTTASCDDAIDQPLGSDIVVRVAKIDEDIVLDGMFVVAATPREVWAVMLDYDRMADFLENIQESRIIEKSADKIIVFQRGKAVLGPFSAPYETTRQVDLVSVREVRSHVIGGNIKKSTGIVLLEPGLTETKVFYHNETIPNVYAPFVLTKSSIEAQVRRQLELMRAEILRRKSLPRKPE